MWRHGCKTTFSEKRKRHVLTIKTVASTNARIMVTDAIEGKNIQHRVQLHAYKEDITTDWNIAQDTMARSST